VSFSRRQCKDSRDRIFSLLAIAPLPLFDGYRPDYAATAAECYMDVFNRIIERDRNGFRVLLGDGFGPNDSGMPSWVRDFSKAQTSAGVELRRLNVFRMFDCSAGLAGTPCVKNRKELHVEARKADTIVAVGPMMQPVRDFMDAVKGPMSEWTKLCAQALRSADPTLIRETLSRVICATLTQNLSVGPLWRRCVDSDIPSAMAWQRFLEGDLSNYDGAYLGAVELATACRCLYITQSGKIGLANSGARAGDEIWALAGLNVPFVLRKVREGGRGLEYVYYSIGDCFLLDGMDGEIMRNGDEPRSVILI
jgi:hypothetical protein